MNYQKQVGLHCILIWIMGQFDTLHTAESVPLRTYQYHKNHHQNQKNDEISLENGNRNGGYKHLLVAIV